MNQPLREITSLQHPLVKHLVKLRQNRSYRYDHKTLVVEGIKPLQELAETYQPKLVLAYDISLIPPKWHGNDCIIVSENVMQKVSGMVHPDGLLAEIEMPKPADFSKLKRIVALDAVSDPGNLGALLRTALALGWDGVFLLENCCDPYNDKAIRAARGANFKLPIKEGHYQDLQKLITDNALSPLVADLNGAPPEKYNDLERVLLLLGNEAHGPSAEAISMCQKVSIPISSQMESLNVAAAGAILMYVLKL